MKKNKKEERYLQSKSGITLIALVITIIVLLILAGVSINMIAGNNGILTQAQNAKEANRAGEVQEAKNLWEMEKLADETTGTSSARTLGEVVNELVEQGLLTEEEKDQILGNDETGIEATGKVTIGGKEIEFGIEDKNTYVEGVPIPEGFYYVGGTKASGVVISDKQEDENKYKNKTDVGSDLKGNQFVWVPVNSEIGNNDMFVDVTSSPQELTSVTDVDGEVTTKRYSKLYSFTGTNTKTLYSDKPSSTSRREPDILSNATSGEVEKYGSIISRETGKACASVEQVAEQYVEDYNAMIESVQKYGGFYVGRYELTGTVDSPTQVKGNVLTSINWYNAYNACQSFTKGKVQSTMIWGTQWDAIMAWIQSTAETTGKYVDSENNSINWGNYRLSEFEYDANLDGVIEEGEVKSRYTDTAIPTGSATYTRVNNIYDLAGNYQEWTQEAYGTNIRVMRGYDCSNAYTDIYCAASRSNNIVTYSNSFYSSRPTLYIK